MTASDSIRVLIVDHEAPARQRLADLLRKDPEVAAILEAADGFIAVAAIQSRRPDLVFLDVQLPELDGLEMIDVIGAGQMPLTVFVTAYDQHAIRAFEANALDYLLKPFSDERFEAAFGRAKARLHERGTSEFGQRMMKMLSADPQTQRKWDRLVVKSRAARTLSALQRSTGLRPPVCMRTPILRASKSSIALLYRSFLSGSIRGGSYASIARPS